MNRINKYTFLTLFLAFIFIFCSIVGMNYILHFREKQLLTESGKVIVESPVRAWYGRESDVENENVHNEKYMLTEEQIVDVISYWNSREMELLHNPVDGQISMEEAIQTGESWLVEMGVVEGNGQEAEHLTDSVKATLALGGHAEDSGKQFEPYYSFWRVEFSNQSRNVIVYVNAVSGNVWRAEVTLYQKFSEKTPFEYLSLFLEMAGFENAKTESPVVNENGTQAVLEIEDSLLYGKAEYCYIPFKGNGYYDILEGNSHSDTVLEQGYMKITYEILPNYSSK